MLLVSASIQESASERPDPLQNGASLVTDVAVDPVHLYQDMLTGTLGFSVDAKLLPFLCLQFGSTKFD